MLMPYYVSDSKEKINIQMKTVKMVTNTAGVSGILQPVLKQGLQVWKCGPAAEISAAWLSALFKMFLLSASDGVPVVLLGRMHPIVVKLPPLLGVLSGPLVLLCGDYESFRGWVSWWDRVSSHQSGPAYHHSPLRRSSQTHSSSPRETLSFAHLQPGSASAQLQEQRV